MHQHGFDALAYLSQPANSELLRRRGVLQLLMAVFDAAPGGMRGAAGEALQAAMDHGQGRGQREFDPHSSEAYALQLSLLDGSESARFARLHRHRIRPPEA